MLRIHSGLAPAPLGQGWRQPWPRGALPLLTSSAMGDHARIF